MIHDATELTEVARSLGLIWENKPDKLPRELHPGAPLFEHWVRSENVFRGWIDGVAVAMFDLHTTVPHMEDSDEHWTIIVFSHSRLPEFVCVPRSWSTAALRARPTPLSFDRRPLDAITRRTVADFEKVYVLGLSDTMEPSAEDAVRCVFSAPRLEVLAQYPGWYIQSADGMLVLAGDAICPVADRPAQWHEAVALRRALLAPVSPAVASIPAVPRMDVGRQRNRRSSGRAGCKTGLVIGFFGNVIIPAILFSSRSGIPGHALPDQQPGGLGVRWDVLFVLFPVCFFGSPIVGAVAGFWLGRRLADLRYDPARKDAPVLRINKWWVELGGGLGFLVGGAVGMGLTAVVTRVGQPLWLMPILFFSPACAGLILGCFAGRAFARRRAAQTTGQQDVRTTRQGRDPL